MFSDHPFRNSVDIVSYPLQMVSLSVKDTFKPNETSNLLMYYSKAVRKGGHPKTKRMRWRCFFMQPEQNEIDLTMHS